MLIKKVGKGEIQSSEITPESIWLSRRQFIQSGMYSAIAGMAAWPSVLLGGAKSSSNSWLDPMLADRDRSGFRLSEELTPEDTATNYNNYYEFGTGKTDPAENARNLRVSPWNLSVEGEVEKKGDFQLEDIVTPHQLEERIYRFRCVEAWSMVIPWVGIPLATVLKQFKPLSSARYVRFESLFDPEQMPGQRSLFSSIDYPYVEGLRIDEAMHELAFLAVGIYGKTLPPQNGAPLRLVVPWKYGFKSIKAIVKIEFVAEQPVTTWERANPQEYGFFANVNPRVSHPRWSQARERVLPNSLFNPRYKETLLFNGYGEQVADLYQNMDLTRYF